MGSEAETKQDPVALLSTKAFSDPPFLFVGLPRWHSSKNLPAGEGDTGDVGLILVSGRSPGGGNGNPL